MFSLTKAEATEFLPELEKLSAPTAGASAPTAAAGDGRATVLVVDDDDDVRNYATAVLEEAGYHVLGAASPSEALHRLGDAPTVDLMFTDLVLPEIDGLKLAELAKRRHPALSVLYTSGDPARFDRPRAAHDGRFLAKPYRSTQLEQAVGDAMTQRAV